ncbi:MAG: MFS transporter, partial [Ilumatobacteraceae bacterium]
MFNVLRTNRDVRFLFIADNISIMGDFFTYIALAGLVKDFTDSNLLVAFVYVAFTLPSFFLSPLAGPVADKFDRRKILIIFSLLQALCGVGFLFITHNRIWIGLLAQTLITGLSAFVNTAYSAALPNLVRNDVELRQANALFGSSWGVMVFAGAALGGLFSQIFGRTATFAADIATFLIATFLILRIKTPMQEARAEQHQARVRPIADMGEALHLAKNDHTIFALIASKTTFAVGAGAVGQLAVLAVDAFHTGDGGLGLLFAARGIGSALGPIVAIRIVRNNLARLLTTCGIAGFLFALGYLGAAVSPTLIVACLCIMIAHFSGGAQWTLSTYGLQMRAPDRLRGRVLAGDIALVTLMLGVSSVVAGILSEFFEVRMAMAMMAILAGIAATLNMTLT